MNSSPTAASVHVGTPPPDFKEWSSTKVYIRGFANLSTERGARVASPDFMALGNPWCLWLRPGGRMHSRAGWVAIYLHNRSNKSIDMNFGFSINDGNGKQIVSIQTSTPFTFDPRGSQSSGKGWPDFAKRSKLLNALVDGTLVVEVHMKPIEPIIAMLPHFIPENPFCNNMLQLFNDEESSDIVFQVSQQSKKNSEKVAKIAPVTFYAHCLILNNAGSAILADLCGTKGDPTTPIEITDVSPEVFRHLLYYIYGGKTADDDTKAHSKDIIDASNRYGVSTLKLEAEACLVESTTFSLDNVIKHLIYADSMNCALLKEAAMDFIVENKIKVIETMTSFDDVPSNLMRDLLTAVARGEREEGGVGGENENLFTTMRINELRKKAHEKGLDVDGSREMLIATLIANS